MYEYSSNKSDGKRPKKSVIKTRPILIKCLWETENEAAVQSTSQNEQAVAEAIQKVGNEFLNRQCCQK